MRIKGLNFNEIPGRRFAYGVVNRGGYLLRGEFPTRSAAVQHFEKDWGMKWRKIKKEYAVRIVLIVIQVVAE